MNPGCAKAGGLFSFLLGVCVVCAWAQSTDKFDRALTEFRGGNYPSAAALFAETENDSPGKTDALLYRAKCLVHLQDFSGADQSLRGYLAAHADSSDGLYMLGFVLHRENRPADSLAAYTKAAALSRPTSDDLKIVALDYVLLADYPDAIKWLEKAVGMDQTNKDAWYYLGRAYYASARLGDSRKAFEAVLDLEPHNVRAESNLGLILESSGEPSAAIETYRRAIAWQEQSLQPSEQPYVNLGNLLMEQGHDQDASAALEKAVAIAPNNGFCQMSLGVYYRKIRRLQEAEEHLERATQIDPENAVAHYQLGRLYAELHASDRAKAEFERTAELKSRAAAPVSVQH